MRKTLPARIAIAAALLFAGSVSVVAQDATSSDGALVYHLLVAHKDGSQVKVAFKHRPELRHDGTAIQLTSQELDMTYPDGTLDYFKIIAEPAVPSGIVAPVSGAPAARPVLTSDGVSVSGAQPGDYVTVYTVDGKIAGSAVVDPQGSAEVSLSHYATGIYIIKSGNTTFKMIKK